MKALLLLLFCTSTVHAKDKHPFFWEGGSSTNDTVFAVAYDSKTATHWLAGRTHDRETWKTLHLQDDPSERQRNLLLQSFSARDYLSSALSRVTKSQKLRNLQEEHFHDCFLMQVHTHYGDKSPIKYSTGFGATQKSKDTCLGVAVANKGGHHALYVTGYIHQKNITFPDQDSMMFMQVADSPAPLKNSKINGFLMMLSLDPGEGVNDKDLPKGTFLQDAFKGVMYPSSVAVDPETGDVYVAGTGADSKERDIAIANESPGHVNNDKAFYGFVKKFKAGTLKQLWHKHLFTDNMVDVVIKDLNVSPGGKSVLVTGTTSGTGEPFGGANFASIGDLDGFITKLNATDGSLWASNMNKDPNDKGMPSSVRIYSNVGQHEDIGGSCVMKPLPGHVTSEGSIFVIGSTTGTMGPPHPANPASAAAANNRNLAAKWKQDKFKTFVTKYHIDTLAPLWTKGISAVDKGEEKKIFGTDCAVWDDPDGDDPRLYIGGTVFNEGHVAGHDVVSHGGNDGYLISYNAHTGKLNYTMQVGSKFDEEISKIGGEKKYGGKYLAVDVHGHVALVGRTMGSFGDPDAEMFDSEKVFLSHFYRRPSELGTTPPKPSPSHPTNNAPSPSVPSPIATKPSGSTSNVEKSSDKMTPMLFGLFFFAFALVGGLVGGSMWLKKQKNINVMKTEADADLTLTVAAAEARNPSSPPREREVI